MDKIIQVSGFGVANTRNTQTDYMIVALTESGRVLITQGDGNWCNISPKKHKGGEDECNN